MSSSNISSNIIYSILFFIGIIIFAAIIGFVVAKVFKDNSADKADDNNTDNAKTKVEIKEVDRLFQQTKKAFEENTNYPEVGTVKFSEQGLVFSACGKFVLTKDFNGIKGNHFAFEIRSTALIFKPDNYEDVCDYEGNGFVISAGYHDGVALSKPENKNGIIIKDDFSSLKGKVIALNDHSGYQYNIRTVETDDLFLGFVKILESTDNSVTITFMADAPQGVNDVFAGTVKLDLDKDFTL